jgi:hypothetical protein
LEENLSAYRINFYLSVATTWNAAGNNTRSAGYTLSFCLYSRGTGANSTRLESLLSRSAFISMTGSSVSRLQVWHPSGISNSTAISTVSASGAATNISTYLVNSVGGFRVLPMPISSTITPGRYWLALANSSASANASVGVHASVLQVTKGGFINYQHFGTSSSASNASFYGANAGAGTYSVTSGAFPATVNLSSQIRNPVTVTYPYFNFSAYTTATNVA